MTNSRNAATGAAKNLEEKYNLRDEMPPRIREARGAMTGREFARRCGIAEQSLSRYERVGNYLPGPELLRKMCLAANVSADWLLCLTDKRRALDEPPAQNVATASATAPHATATANAGTLPTDAVADLLRRVLAASSTRASDPPEQRLEALERGLAALASQLAR